MLCHYSTGFLLAADDRRLMDLLIGNMDSGSDANADVGVTMSRGRDRDDLLFMQLESSCFGDCPICFLPMPIDEQKHMFTSCCSKMICLGCDDADIARHVNGSLQQTPCPFCRHPLPTTHAECDANTMRRAKANDPVALLGMGFICYRKGEYNKAFQYWTKAADLGDARAHYHIASLYHEGKGVEKDEQKIIHHLKEAAIAGHLDARYKLGVIEWNEGSKARAVKHFIIAANLGDGESLNMLMRGYKEGVVSKDDFAAALRAHQAAVDEMKSPQRDAAYEKRTLWKVKPKDRR